MIVALTGASGSMGKETLKRLLEVAEVTTLRILLKAEDRAFGRKAQRKYGERLEVIYGDVRNKADCIALVTGAAYVYHLAAVIPPRADHDTEDAVTTNYDGTVNMVDAVIETGNTARFIHISTVALYGNRDEKHPWGRVGDPLITSAFDLYGTSKLRAERYLLESDLAHWAVLRQTGILYDNMLMNNISDGLMFHTPWNVPIEWVTARDSGRLMKNILLRTMDGGEADFWRGVYNIGGGAPCRQTGYETFDDGFKLIGGSVKSFFEPGWNALRNFHCFWFSDSDALEERFHFREESCASFWQWFLSRHKIYSVGKIVPAPLLKSLVIKRLLRNDNAPYYWRKHGEDARVYAIYGDAEIPAKWADFDLLCERESYAALKVHSAANDLSHGYDESKSDVDIDGSDLAEAAAFRGGEVVGTYKAGDIYKKVAWRCHNGHVFESSPFTVLKAGHWCPECAMPDKRWTFDSLAKVAPFYAQVWYDTHARDEDKAYGVRDGKAYMEEIK